MVKEDGMSLEEQHRNCPKDDQSWCKFWSDRTKYNDGKRLSAVFMPELMPIFMRLSNDTLLSRCLLGITQNQNEAVNGVLWSRCPKTKFCGRTKLVMAVSETVCHFNTGAGYTLSLMETLDIEPSSNMLSALRREDSDRIKEAARKVSEKARLLRRKKKEI